MTRDELNDLFDGPENEKMSNEIADKILESFNLLENLVANLEHEKEDARKKAAKIIRNISEKAPASIYPYFEKIEKMLDSEDYEVRSSAMATIANLVPVDKDEKITEDVWSKIASFISDTSSELATAAMDALGAIAKHTDTYKDKIASLLLQATKTGKETVDNNEKIKKVMEVLDDIGDNIDREHLKKIEVELKQGLDDAVETTKEAAEDLWNKIKMFGGKKEETPKDKPNKEQQ